MNDPIAAINQAAAEIRANTAAKVNKPIAGSAYARDASGSDVHRKARAIQHMLGGLAEFHINEAQERIHWRKNGSNRWLAVDIPEFMDPRITVTNVADGLGLDPNQIAESKNRGGPAWVSGNLEYVGDFADPPESTESLHRAEKVEEAIATTISNMLVTSTRMEKVVEAMVELANVNTKTGDAIIRLGEMMPAANSDEVIKARASYGLEAMVLDIQAEILNGDDAVRERASEWLTKVTSEITGVLRALDKEGDTDGQHEH